ncbi:hypothetical protein QQF64_014628 [Cirrhinus molitorella]|uniref:Uncharacterized protein n=1 Tax=Cirrhinus molitorella TaxID=172907 RepID=A0ABR3NTL5_9TELE
MGLEILNFWGFVRYLGRRSRWVKPGQAKPFCRNFPTSPGIPSEKRRAVKSTPVVLSSVVLEDLTLVVSAPVVPEDPTLVVSALVVPEDLTPVVSALVVLEDLTLVVSAPVVPEDLTLVISAPVVLEDLTPVVYVPIQEIFSSPRNRRAHF